MSELYDSLEDEGDENSCNSSNDVNNNLFNSKKGFLESGSIDRQESFFLNQKGKTGGNESQVLQVQSTIDLTTKNYCQVKSFLPKVDKEYKKYGPSSASFNLVVDDEDLNKKGLQCNKDGSFTKSPRLKMEKLPFVNPVYKNMNPEKIKMFDLRKKTNSTKKNGKSLSTYDEKSTEKTSVVGISSTRGTKGSNEEILTSDESVLSLKRTNSKTEKDFVGNDNLTDSMKEMLMQKQDENKMKKAQCTSEQFKKSKLPVNLLGIRKNPKFQSSSGDVPHNKDQCSGKSNSKQTLPDLVSSGKEREDYSKRKDASGKKLPVVDQATIKRLNSLCVVKHQSNILLSSSKPRLSYLERHQKENGFNPMYLRYGVKRIPSDTNRSIFGDSVAENLSEPSSRIVSCKDIVDDDDGEETFYRKLIEKEKCKQREANQTSRSEIHMGGEKCGHFGSSSFCKNQNELERSDKLCSKQKLRKSTSIDMPTKFNTSRNPTKKYSHYCSENVSSSMSKIELALKAKAYGYMANARNIFKMKTQSEAKLVPFEAGTCKDGKMNLRKVVNHRMSVSQNEISDEFKGGFQMSSRRLPRTSKSLCKTDKCETLVDKEMVLPPVCCSEAKDNEYKPEVLKRIQSCLSGAAGTKENICNFESKSVYGTPKELRMNYVDSLLRFNCAR